MKAYLMVLYLLCVCVCPSAIAQAQEIQEVETKVRMLFAHHEAVVVMDTHPAAQDFISMLPLTLSFEDFNGTEKIGYLPRKLNMQNSPGSCSPSAGSFAYYAPWGNLAVFYRDFRYSDGLVPLGHIESGVEFLAKMSGNFSVRLEKME